MNADEEEPIKFNFSAKTAVAVLLTLLLGPGVGHLYLRKIKQGVIFLALTFAFALHQAWEVVKNIPVSQLSSLKSDDISALFNNFAVQYPKVLFIYDVIFAALWAYAVIDAFKKSRER
ncbi:MAG: hypothetical protein LHV68_03465 [Elusimicrobia bacterium]|nr:hypothetical protein [Candidatus Liberimonas magnetica]